MKCLAIFRWVILFCGLVASYAWPWTSALPEQWMMAHLSVQNNRLVPFYERYMSYYFPQPLAHQKGVFNWNIDKESVDSFRLNLCVKPNQLVSIDPAFTQYASSSPDGSHTLWTVLPFLHQDRDVTTLLMDEVGSINPECSSFEVDGSVIQLKSSSCLESDTQPYFVKLTVNHSNYCHYWGPTKHQETVDLPSGGTPRTCGGSCNCFKGSSSGHNRQSEDKSRGIFSGVVTGRSSWFVRQDGDGGGRKNNGGKEQINKDVVTADIEHLKLELTLYLQSLSASDEGQRSFLAKWIYRKLSRETRFIQGLRDDSVARSGNRNQRHKAEALILRFLNDIAENPEGNSPGRLLDILQNSNLDIQRVIDVMANGVTALPSPNAAILRRLQKLSLEKSKNNSASTSGDLNAGHLKAQQKGSRRAAASQPEHSQTLKKQRTLKKQKRHRDSPWPKRTHLAHQKLLHKNRHVHLRRPADNLPEPRPMAREEISFVYMGGSLIQVETSMLQKANQLEAGATQSPDTEHEFSVYSREIDESMSALEVIAAEQEASENLPRIMNFDEFSDDQDAENLGLIPPLVNEPEGEKSETLGESHLNMR